MTRKDLVTWLRQCAGADYLTYEQRYRAIELLIKMGEL